jgi:hypothetical protein
VPSAFHVKNGKSHRPVMGELTLDSGKEFSATGIALQNGHPQTPSRL